MKALLIGLVAGAGVYFVTRKTVFKSAQGDLPMENLPGYGAAALAGIIVWRIAK